jgi:hypothetical protein
MSGAVKSATGVLPGATVEVVHKPTGTKYYSTTDSKGGGGLDQVGLIPKSNLCRYQTTEITEINAP